MKLILTINFVYINLSKDSINIKTFISSFIDE